MAAGVVFPPLVVYFDGTLYWLADGFHRYWAAEALGLAEVACDVRQGTRRDAVLHSVGANAGHGHRRTNDDKRRAVLTMLDDEEWRRWGDREIARQCGVAHSFVVNLRAERHPPPASGLGDQTPGTRTVQRGGTVYEMRTGGINAGRERPEAPEPHRHKAPAPPDWPGRSPGAPAAQGRRRPGGAARLRP